jgi:hypothetical protein
MLCEEPKLVAIAVVGDQNGHVIQIDDEIELRRLERDIAGLSSRSESCRSSLHRLRREKFDEMIIDAVGRFYLQGVAGRERLGVDEVARESAPYGGIFLGRRRAPRTPQHQERRHDLAILLGRVGLEIDCGICAIVAAGADDRLFCEAADIVVKHDLGKLRGVTSASQKPSPTALTQENAPTAPAT